MMGTQQPLVHSLPTVQWAAQNARPSSGTFKQVFPAQQAAVAQDSPAGLQAGGGAASIPGASGIEAWSGMMSGWCPGPTSAGTPAVSGPGVPVSAAGASSLGQDASVPVDGPFSAPASPAASESDGAA